MDLAWLTEGWQAALWLAIGLLVGRAWQAWLWRDPPRPEPWSTRTCREWDPERWTRGVWS